MTTAKRDMRTPVYWPDESTKADFEADAKHHGMTLSSFAVMILRARRDPLQFARMMQVLHPGAAAPGLVGGGVTARTVELEEENASLKDRVATLSDENMQLRDALLKSETRLVDLQSRRIAHLEDLAAREAGAMLSSEEYESPGSHTLIEILSSHPKGLLQMETSRALVERHGRSPEEAAAEIARALRSGTVTLDSSRRLKVAPGLTP